MTPDARPAGGRRINELMGPDWWRTEAILVAQLRDLVAGSGQHRLVPHSVRAVAAAARRLRRGVSSVGRRRWPNPTGIAAAAEVGRLGHSRR